jgi:hypothetical protein
MEDAFMHRLVEGILVLVLSPAVALEKRIDADHSSCKGIDS